MGVQRLRSDDGGISASEIENYILHLHPITIPKLAHLQSLLQLAVSPPKHEATTKKEADHTKDPADDKLGTSSTDSAQCQFS